MKKNALFVVLLLGAVMPREQLQADPLIIGSLVVSSLINQIKEDTEELISEAEASSSVVGFSVATDAKILVQNLDVMARALTGKVFDDLDSSQQALFKNAASVLKESDRSLEERLSDIDSIFNGFGAEVSRLPGVSDRPLLKHYSPSYILNNRHSYNLVLSGSRLNSASPELTFGDVSCKNVSSLENTLRFDCPNTLFSNENNGWVAGKFSLTKPAAWYQFWADDEQFEYSIGVMVIQEKMGDFSLKVTREVAVDLRKPRSQSNNYRNEHCDGDQVLVRTYRPESGCRIDVHTVNAKATVISKESSFEGTLNVSDNGFQTRGHVRNNGTCIWPARDARGALNVVATWVDICSVNKEEVLPEEQGELMWSKEISFSMPADTKSFVLTIRQVDGKVKVISGTTSSGWFNTYYDIGANLLVVKPREVDEAFK